VSTPAVFYFDLASPLAYLASEQVMHLLCGPVEWQPVLARELGGSESLQAQGWETDEQVFREDISRRASALGLQPLRWPNPFPFDSSLAMRAATYAKSIGRAVPFAQAAFRQAFAGGRSLGELDSVLIAAAACEMHPRAVHRAIELRSVREQLARSTEDASRAGVSAVPAVRSSSTQSDPGRGTAGCPGRVFVGERALREAAAYEGGRAAPTPQSTEAPPGKASSSPGGHARG
jgi:2-hydroxychromene-2-carboxylate isomerase